MYEVWRRTAQCPRWSERTHFKIYIYIYNIYTLAYVLKKNLRRKKTFVFFYIITFWYIFREGGERFFKKEISAGGKLNLGKYSMRENFERGIFRGWNLPWGGGGGNRSGSFPKLDYSVISELNVPIL